MKWAYLAAACVVFFGALIGFILPTLISTKSDIAVLVGGGVGILVFLGTVHVVARYFTKEKAE